MYKNIHYSIFMTPITWKQSNCTPMGKLLYFYKIKYYATIENNIDHYLWTYDSYNFLSVLIKTVQYHLFLKLYIYYTSVWGMWLERYIWKELSKCLRSIWQFINEHLFNHLALFINNMCYALCWVLEKRKRTIY